MINILIYLFTSLSFYFLIKYRNRKIVKTYDQILTHINNIDKEVLASQRIIWGIRSPLDY